MIALNLAGDAYQLTSDGRYYVTVYLAQQEAQRKRRQAEIEREDKRLKEQWERDEREYHEHSHMDIW